MSPDPANDGPATSNRDFLVIGAGLAGLSAASRLAREGHRVTVLEASDHVGGLAASFTKQTEWGEFDYDNGPHRFHTGETHLNDEVLRLLGDNVCTANRQSRIFLYNKFFHYPLQGSNVLGLPKLVLIRAFWDYLVVKVRNLFHRRPDDNFENWVINRFGRKLYEVFFGVYTEKTWGIPCTEISADWAAQRISLLSLWDTVKKTFFKPKGAVPRTLVSKFYYPRRGGIGELCRGYRRELEGLGNKVVTGARVTKVEHRDGQVVGVRYLKDGQEHRISGPQVIGTVPLTRLVKLMDPPAPSEVIQASDSLTHRSMIFVFLILDRESVTPDHWIYLPEQKVITHRLSEFKNFSPDAAPKDKTLLCAEITCDYDDADWNKTDEELQQLVVKDLTQFVGLIKAEEVLHTFSRRERYAYPIYDLTYRDHRDKLLQYVDSFLSLDTTGRQGLFKYNNMDHSIGMGLAIAENVLGRGSDHRSVASGQQYFG